MFNIEQFSLYPFLSSRDKVLGSSKFQQVSNRFKGNFKQGLDFPSLSRNLSPKFKKKKIDGKLNCFPKKVGLFPVSWPSHEATTFICTLHRLYEKHYSKRTSFLHIWDCFFVLCRAPFFLLGPDMRDTISHTIYIALANCSGWLVWGHHMCTTLLVSWPVNSCQLVLKKEYGIS